jgi:hypothetical protein
MGGFEVGIADGFVVEIARLLPTQVRRIARLLEGMVYFLCLAGWLRKLWGGSVLDSFLDFLCV